MPIHGFPGGVISSTAVTPSSTSASGVWTLDEQLQAQGVGNWPMPPLMVDNSARLRSSATASFTRIPATNGNRTTWTWSAWVKRGTLGVLQTLFGTAYGEHNIYFAGGDALNFQYDDGVYNYRIATTQVFRDPSAWYHIVVVWNTTSGTTANRMRIYVNGSEVTALSVTNYPTQDFNGIVNYVTEHSIGKLSTTRYFDGYMTEMNFIDGQALTPSSFGQTSTATGVWQPKKYVGTYGTNGFYLPMNVSQTGYTAEYLVVAGGGGASIGGAGGGGGYRSSVTGESSGGGASAENYAILASGTTYTVTVGAGGAGAYPGVNGDNSVFGPITSLGGGGGGQNNGLSGGCGGGGRGDNQSSFSGGSGTTGQGYAGGDAPANVTFQAGGGGGGAGAVGGASSGSTPGAGGAGVSSSITGSAVTRSQGGGGCTLSSTLVYANPTGAGGANTGRGGGATRTVGFNGGSGVVILKILTANYSGTTSGSPTVTTSGSYTILTYNSSGSYTA